MRLRAALKYLPVPLLVVALGLLVFSFIVTPFAFVSAPNWVFQKITGKTSYEWFHQKADIYTLIQNQLQQHPARLDMSILQTAESWDQICIFSHPLVQGRSSELLGFNWDVADYVPELVESDSTVALVFSRQTDRKVVYFVSVGRDLLDLSDYRNRCIPKAEAHFTRVDQGPVYALESSK